MPQKQHNELVAGIFIISILVILVGVGLWIGASGLLQSEYQEAVFFAKEDENPGLKKGSIVLLSGVEVGRIVRVDLDVEAGRAYFVARIFREDVTIHADSVPYVSAGLVGDAKLVVTRGSVDEPLADWEHPVHVGGGLDEAIRHMVATLKKLRETVEVEFNREDPETLISKLHATVNNLKVSTDNIAVITADVVPQTDPTNPDGLVSKANRLAGKLYLAADEMAKLLVDAQTLLGKINRGEGTLGKLVVDDRVHRELLDATHQLAKLLEETRALLDQWKSQGVGLKLK